MGNWYDPYLALGDPVIVTDSAHRILAVNEAYESTSGFKFEQLIGKGAGAIKSGLTPNSVYDSLKQSLKHLQAWKGIFTNRRPNGNLWNSFVTITPIPTPLGDVGYVGICRDIQDVTIQDIAQSYRELFRVIASMAESTDPMLENHLSHVGLLTEIMAKALGLPKETVEWLSMASYLHDVGKLFIPKEILFKPGRFVDEEKEFIKAHTTLGERFLNNLHEGMAKIFGYNEALIYAREMANYHHERFDGKGYPNGLQASDIPLSARIATLADVIDALVSKRPYKDSWSFDDVRSYIVKEKGKQFDPRLVDVILLHWESVVSIYK